MTSEPASNASDSPMVDDFLIAECQRFAQTLISEREAVDRMVQNFITISAALGGAYFAFYRNPLNVNAGITNFALILFLSIYFIYGVAVLIRLVKRHWLSKQYVYRLRDVRELMAKRYSILTEFVGKVREQEDSNLELGKYIDRFGGAGPVILLVNSVNASLIVGNAIPWLWEQVFKDIVSFQIHLAIGVIAFVLVSIGQYYLQKKIKDRPIYRTQKIHTQ